MKRAPEVPRPSVSVSPGAAAFVCALGMGCVMFEQTSLVVTAPVIVADLGGGISGLQWLTALFSLVAASTMPLSGLLGQRIGSRTTVQLGLAVMMAGATLAALSPTLAVLLGSRIILGMGAALVLPNSATLLGANVADAAQRTRAIGLWMTAGTTALLFGPLVGGLIVEHLGWRLGFLVWIPVAATAIVLLRRLDTSPRATAGRVDLAGLFLASTALALIAWSLISSGRQSAPWIWVVVTTTAAMIVALLFVWVERRTRHPLLDFKVFRPRRVRMLLLACFTYNAAINGTAILLSVHLQDQRDFSASSVGVMFLVANLGMPLAGLLVPRLRRHRDNVELMVVGLWGLAVAYLWIGVGASWHPVLLAIPLALIGLGAGILYFVDTNTILDQVSGPETASTMAALTLMRQIGSVMGIAALASIGQWTMAIDVSDAPGPPGILFAGATMTIVAAMGTRWVLRRGAHA